MGFFAAAAAARQVVARQGQRCRQSLGLAHAAILLMDATISSPTMIAAVRVRVGAVSATPTKVTDRLSVRKRTTTLTGALERSRRFTIALLAFYSELRSMNKRVFAASLAAAGFILGGPAQAASEGEGLYAPCKACHLATGKGVPGAFPPLKQQITAFAATPEGRTYLALIIKRGGIGRIKVDGKTYVGAMPAQGRLSSEKIASLLNYVVTDIAGGEGLEPFTATEVQGIVDANPKARGKDVIAMRPDPDAAAAKKTFAPSVETDAPATAKEAKAPVEAPMTADDKRWEAHLKERTTKS